jgi:hypothetical protein
MTRASIRSCCARSPRRLTSSGLRAIAGLDAGVLAPSGAMMANALDSPAASTASTSTKIA